MNINEIRAQVNRAMSNDNVVDAKESNSISARIIGRNGPTVFEIAAVRSLLTEAQREVNADRALLASASSALDAAPLTEKLAAAQAKADAAQALAVATNRRDALRVIKATVEDAAGEDVVRSANQAHAVGRFFGHDVPNFFEDLGDRVGDAVHDLAGHRPSRLDD